LQVRMNDVQIDAIHNALQNHGWSHCFQHFVSFDFLWFFVKVIFAFDVDWYVVHFLLASGVHDYVIHIVFIILLFR
jgi:hypothetical protein